MGKVESISLALFAFLILYFGLVPSSIFDYVNSAFNGFNFGGVK